MKKHLVIAGERHVGKSTLVNRLLTGCEKPVYGFRTAKGGSLEDGYRLFYMYPADKSESNQSRDNLIGKSNGKERAFYSEVFDNYGVRCLAAEPDGIILMDELGFMELEAHRFCSRVLELLDGDIPVLATAKAGVDCDFLKAVLNHPNADVYYIDEQNRNDLYDQLKDHHIFKGGSV